MINSSRYKFVHFQILHLIKQYITVNILLNTGIQGRLLTWMKTFHMMCKIRWVGKSAWTDWTKVSMNFDMHSVQVSPHDTISAEHFTAFRTRNIL